MRLLIAHYVPTSSVMSVTYKHGEIDALVQLADDEVVVFEVKAGHLADSAKLARDEQSIDAHLRKRYVRNEKNEGKGIVQLARAVGALYDGTLPGIQRTRCVYPVLVVEDPSMQSLAVQCRAGRELVSVDGAMPLTLVTIDELDIILRSVATGDIHWNDVFRVHIVNNKAAAISVSATLHELAAARALPIPPDTFLQGAGRALTRMLGLAAERAELGRPTTDRSLAPSGRGDVHDARRRSLFLQSVECR